MENIKPSHPIPEPVLAKIPKDAPFTIKAIPTKGLGAFAICAIPKGTLILAEKPLLRIEKSYYCLADVEEAYNELIDEQKTAYISLASAHGQDPARWPSQAHPLLEVGEKRRIQEQHAARIAGEKSVYSVCLTNAMQAASGAGIFEIASRFNHDCVPNACFAWDGRKGMETIHAVRDITEGEEITLCYCDPFYDVSMRRWELNHYGFECVCKACMNLDDSNSFGHASRERRWKLREWDEELQFCFKDDDKLRLRMQMVAAMQEEGLCTPGLGLALLEIARICERCGDIKNAVKAAKMALEVNTTCLGAESERAEVAAKAVRAFEKQWPHDSLKN